MTDRPGQPSGSEANESHAEQVLAQALRSMVGGAKPAPGSGLGAGGPPAPSDRRRLTTGQLLLLAAIIGLLIGIGAGLLWLVL